MNITRRVTLSTDPSIKVNTQTPLVTGLDNLGYQYQIDLTILPVGVSLDMIKAGQIWMIERRTGYNRLFMSLTPITPKTSALTGYYANFYSTVNQTAATINTPYAITNNVDAGSYGFVLGSGSNTSRIYAQNAGTYNFQFSAQFTNSNTAGNSFNNASVWTRQNGVDVPWSAGEISAGNKNPNVLAAWNNIVVMASGDYIEYMWAVDATTVYLLSTSNPIYGPAIPSMIATATQL